MQRGRWERKRSIGSQAVRQQSVNILVLMQVPSPFKEFFRAEIAAKLRHVEQVETDPDVRQGVLMNNANAGELTAECRLL